MNADETRALIAEARRAEEFARANRYGQRSHADLIVRLADALEGTLAARQPSGDDREALARRLREGDDPVNTWEQATEAQREFWRNEADRALGSRAAALDAATERTRQAEAELSDMLRVDIPSLKAERDAALAALERVRAALAHDEIEGHDHDASVYRDEAERKLSEIEAALDGAPEPAGLPVEGEKP